MPPKDVSSRALPGSRRAKATTSIWRALPMQTCWPRRRRPADHLGPHRDARPARSRAQNLGIYRQQVIGRNQRDHALARASRRRARFPRLHAGASGRAFPGRGRARRRSGDHARRGDAGAGHAVASTSSPACCAARAPSWSSACGSDLQVPARAEIVLEGSIRPDETARRRPVRRPHRLLQRAGAVPGVRRSSASRMRRDADLPLDLHRQAARRAGGARRGAERGVRAAAAEAVSRDRRLLPAARGLLLPPGRGQHEEAVPGPRQARDVRRLELPAPVHVHQVHRRDRRRRRRARLEGSDLGASPRASIRRATR